MESDKLKRIYLKLFPLNCKRGGDARDRVCKPCCVDCPNYDKCLDAWKAGTWVWCSNDKKRTWCSTICSKLGYKPREFLNPDPTE